MSDGAARVAIFLAEWCALIGGAYLIGSAHGWETGVGLALLAYVAMPVKP